MNLLLLGPQGSGKGTQAKKIVDDHGVPHVSTGDMFRALDETSEVGREVAAIMARGDLVPDEITIQMIESRLSQDDAVDGFILDGFPRNRAQAEALDGMLAVIGRGLDAILYFDVPDEIARSRALGRAIEEGRADDTAEAIDKRLAIYHDQTAPIVEYYRTTGKLVQLHAERPVGEVYAQIQQTLEQVAVR